MPDQQSCFASTHFGLVLPPLMVAHPLAHTFLITFGFDVDKVDAGDDGDVDGGEGDGGDGTISTHLPYHAVQQHLLDRQ